MGACSNRGTVGACSITKAGGGQQWNAKMEFMERCIYCLWQYPVSSCENELCKLSREQGLRGEQVELLRGWGSGRVVYVGNKIPTTRKEPDVKMMTKEGRVMKIQSGILM